MKVLLVGNYETDGQESMLRSAKMLETGLRKAGVEVALIRPEPFFGKLRRGATGVGKWLGYLDKFLLFPRALRRAAAAADLVHLCDHSNAMYVAEFAGKPHVVTCNDLLAVRSARGEFPAHPTRCTGRWLQRWILSGLGQAKRLACISKATRRDVLRIVGCAPEQASVIYLGQNYPYAPTDEVARASEARRRGEPFDAEALRGRGLPPEPYILHVGGAQWYKNRGGALAMYAALEKRLGAATPRLVLVGPPVDAAGPRVETRRGLSNEALAALYTGAELLLFPSLEEGFGWPVIEAQACGCRVVTTGKAPLTEAGGEAAFYLADPLDAEAGAERMAEVLAQDAAAWVKAVAAGLANAARFTAERTVQEYLALYHEVLAE